MPVHAGLPRGIYCFEVFALAETEMSQMCPANVVLHVATLALSLSLFVDDHADLSER